MGTLSLNLLPLHAAGSVRLICERRAESQRVISAFEYHSRAVMQLQITSRLARYVCLLRASIFRRHAKCLRVIKISLLGATRTFLVLHITPLSNLVYISLEEFQQIALILNEF